MSDDIAKPPASPPDPLSAALAAWEAEDGRFADEELDAAATLLVRSASTSRQAESDRHSG